MKKIIKYPLILTIVLTLFTVQGCTELLNEPKPATQLTTETVLSTPETINGVRINMYTYLLGFEYTTEYLLGPGALADNLVNLRGTSRFSPLVQYRLGAGLGNWDTQYELINNANVILKGIDESVLEEDYLTRIRGEAYFFRAFAYHNLVRAYAYDPGAIPQAGQGAGFELGVPIRTEPTIALSDIEFKPRATVAEVYDLIKSDLQKAIDRLPTTGDVGVFYVNKAAAQALLARVLLYDRSYSEAAATAQTAIQSSGARMANPKEVDVMFNEQEGSTVNPETIFAALPDPITSPGGTEGPSGYTATFWNAMIPSKDVLSLYSEQDARNAWFAPCFSTNKQDCTGGYPGDPAFEAKELQKWNGNRPQRTDNIIFFRVSEMKLIRAEALAFAAGTVTPEAVDALNDVRVNRNLPALTVADFASLNAFIDSVLVERRRELIGEGHRFWDLKRLARDIPKPVGPQFPRMPYTSYQILDNLPQEQVQLSPELIQNPGY